MKTNKNSHETAFEIVKIIETISDVNDRILLNNWITEIMNSYKELSTRIHIEFNKETLNIYGNKKHSLKENDCCDYHQFLAHLNKISKS